MQYILIKYDHYVHVFKEDDAKRVVNWFNRKRKGKKFVIYEYDSVESLRANIRKVGKFKPENIFIEW